MTKLSRWPVEKEKMSLFLDDFWSAVASFENKSEAKNFFSQFLTHTERKMFAKRFQIAMMLIMGYTYKEIKTRVRVTEGTIAKLSNWLEENGREINLISKRIIRYKEEKLNKLRTFPKNIKGRSGGKTVIAEVASGLISLAKARSKQKSVLS